MADSLYRTRVMRGVVVALVGVVAVLGFAAGRSTLASDGVAIWANSTTETETLDVSGSTNTINGLSHSNHEFKVSGSSNSFIGGTEYVTKFQDEGDENTFDPEPTQVSASGFPISFNFADYQPGGAAANAADALGRYFTIDGDLEVSEDVEDGLYYVTGDVDISDSNVQATVTIVALGKIDVSGSEQSLSAFIDGLLLIAGDSDDDALKIAGGDSTLNGHLVAPNGRIELSGSSNDLTCAVLGDRVTLNGSEVTIDGGNCTDGGVQPGEPVQGDVDCDGAVTIGDALKVARYLLGLSVGQTEPCPDLADEVQINGTSQIWGDADCDNNLAIGDALKTARYLLGLSVSQEPGCPAIGSPI